MAYFQPVPGAAIRRSDHGQDYQGKPGGYVVAIGRARVDAIKQDPGGFGIAVYYTLLNGPRKGQQIYVGHAQPTVKVGQVVQGGHPVAKLVSPSLGDAGDLSYWTEVGLAKGGAPEYQKPYGGPPLQALLAGAKQAPAPTEGQTPPPTTKPPPQQQPDQSYLDQEFTDNLSNLPGADQVDTVSAPTIEEDYVPEQLNQIASAKDAWAAIVNQGDVSPATLRLASLAGYDLNASSPVQ